jgi:threonine/homoserine/homoserine lactone efflux protein
MRPALALLALAAAAAAAPPQPTTTLIKVRALERAWRAGFF